MSTQLPSVFSRIIAARAARSPTETPDSKLFLGTSEWDELQHLCALFQHTWPAGGISGYKPEQDETTRAAFQGLRIYRVDAHTFISLQ